MVVPKKLLLCLVLSICLLASCAVAQKGSERQEQQETKPLQQTEIVAGALICNFTQNKSLRIAGDEGQRLYNTLDKVTYARKPSTEHLYYIEVSFFDRNRQNILTVGALNPTVGERLKQVVIGNEVFIADDFYPVLSAIAQKHHYDLTEK